MKSLNRTDTLWTTMSTDTIDTTDYQAACCLNARINAPQDLVNEARIKVEDKEVPVDFFKKVVERHEHAKKNPGHSEDIKHAPEHK